MLKHYVKLYRTGYNSDIVREVHKRDKDFVMNLARKDKTIYAYCFFDRNEIIAEDGEMLLGEVKNISRRVWLRSGSYKVGSGEYGSKIIPIRIPPEKNRL